MALFFWTTSVETLEVSLAVIVVHSSSSPVQEEQRPLRGISVIRQSYELSRLFISFNRDWDVKTGGLHV